MNTNYGRLANGQIEYAPATLPSEDGVKVNPSAASYFAAGWKKVVDEPPAAESGKRVEPSGWAEDATTITRIYKQVKGETRPEGPRTFSKLKVVTALKKSNLWVLTKTWIEERGLYDYYLAAQDFAEDNEWFRQGVTELKKLTGKTDAEIEAILSECVIEER